MCASCGCSMLEDDHGDGRHLTIQDLQAAAEAAGITVQRVAENLQAAAARAHSPPTHEPANNPPSAGQPESHAGIQRS